MKKTHLLVAFALSCVLGIFGVVGCTAPAATNDGGEAVAEFPVIPESHQGRFETLGVEGCWNCHTLDPSQPGAAAAMPDNHYLNGDVTSGKIEPVRNQCVTCHAQA